MLVETKQISLWYVYLQLPIVSFIILQMKNTHSPCSLQESYYPSIQYPLRLSNFPGTDTPKASEENIQRPAFQIPYPHTMPSVSRFVRVSVMQQQQRHLSIFLWK